MNEGSDHASIYIAIYDISGRDQRLHLCLPFVKVLTVHIGQTDIFNTDASTAYYFCDPSADNITYIRCSTVSGSFHIVISTHQIVNLLPPVTETCKTLQWNEWGPICTRWFRGPSRQSIRGPYGSWMYFADRIPELIGQSSIPYTPYQNCAVALCDFNPRIIHRNLGISTPIKTYSQQGTRPERTPAGSTLESDLIASSNLIAQHTITEEWVLRSPAFTEDVCSRLPFRMFIREQATDWDRRLKMGAEPIAVFSVSNSMALPRVQDPLTDYRRPCLSRVLNTSKFVIFKVEARQNERSSLVLSGYSSSTSPKYRSVKHYAVIIRCGGRRKG